MPIPYHDVIIEWMLHKKYKTSDQGVCYGIAHMAMQAILLNDLRRFKLRLKLIASMIPEIKNKSTFKEKRDQVIAHLEDRLEKARKNVTAFIIDNYKKPNEEKRAITQQGIMLKKKLEDEILSGKSLTEIEKDIGQDDKLELDKLILEISAFMDGVALYQTPKSYPDVFEKPPTFQDAAVVLPLLSPVAVAADNKIMNVKPNFIGVYTKDELHESFVDLRKAIEKMPQDAKCVFALHDDSHTICVTYDAEKKNWVFIDSGALPPIKCTSESKLVRQILKTFPLDKGEVRLETDVYTTSNNELHAYNMLKKWQQNPHWEHIHNFKHIHHFKALCSSIEDLKAEEGDPRKKIIQQFKERWREINDEEYELLDDLSDVREDERLDKEKLIIDDSPESVEKYNKLILKYAREKGDIKSDLTELVDDQYYLAENLFYFKNIDYLLNELVKFIKDDEQAKQVKKEIEKIYQSFDDKIDFSDMESRIKNIIEPMVDIIIRNNAFDFLANTKFEQTLVKEILGLVEKKIKDQAASLGVRPGDEQKKEVTPKPGV